MPPKSKKSKKSKKTKSKRKITKKKTSVSKKNTTEAKVPDDFFADLDTSMSYDDMSKEGILEKLKDKLLHNIITTRYNYLTWFGRFNRGYEFVDFLTFYIKNFLQANNPIVNDIFLYARNNSVNRFSDFSDHYYLKNKIIWLREKLVDALNKYILRDTPPLYYSDLASLFLRPKNIYLLKDNDYFITRREDDYKTKLEEIKNSINALKTAPPPPSAAPPPAAAPSTSRRPPETVDERHARAVELGIVDPNTGMPTPGNDGLYNDIRNGTWGFKNKQPLNKKNIIAFTQLFLSNTFN